MKKQAVAVLVLAVAAGCAPLSPKEPNSQEALERRAEERCNRQGGVLTTNPSPSGRATELVCVQRSIIRQYGLLN